MKQDIFKIPMVEGQRGKSEHNLTQYYQYCIFIPWFLVIKKPVENHILNESTFSTETSEY